MGAQEFLWPQAISSNINTCLVVHFCSRMALSPVGTTVMKYLEHVVDGAEPPHQVTSVWCYKSGLGAGASAALLVQTKPTLTAEAGLWTNKIITPPIFATDSLHDRVGRAVKSKKAIARLVPIYQGYMKGVRSWGSGLACQLDQVEPRMLKLGKCVGKSTYIQPFTCTISPKNLSSEVIPIGFKKSLLEVWTGRNGVQHAVIAKLFGKPAKTGKTWTATASGKKSISKNTKKSALKA